MSFYGADVEQLRRLGTDLDRSGADIDAIRSRIDALVGSTAWRGPDAERFRVDWRDHASVDLRKASDALATQAQRARDNARAQEEVSGGSGGLGAMPIGTPIPEQGIWEPAPEPIDDADRIVDPKDDAAPLLPLDPRGIAHDMARIWGRDYMFLDDGTTVVPGRDYSFNPDGSVRWLGEYDYVNQDGTVGPKLGKSPGELFRGVSIEMEN